MPLPLPRLSGLRVLLALFWAVSGPGHAGVEPATEAAAAPAGLALVQRWEALRPRTGTIPLGGDLATVTVPRGFYFLDAADARVVLEEIWGNPPDGGVLGLLLPARYTPFDYGSWAVTIEYLDAGHVPDSDAARIDVDRLLAGMQRQARQANGRREAAGYGRVELLGWAEPPHYDAGKRQLYWAKALRFGGTEETILNYEIRALGRSGVLSMTFIANAAQLEEIHASRDAVRAMVRFTPGNRYSDFDPAVDSLAGYSIGTLVTGRRQPPYPGWLATALGLLEQFWIALAVLAAVAASRYSNALRD